MDISTITDVNALKVMAYDELVNKERAETNLSIINKRIAEIRSQVVSKKEKPNDAKKMDTSSDS